MTFRNFTPHGVCLNDGTVFPSEGVARVSSFHSEFVDGVCSVTFGEVTGLPPVESGVLIIVSAMVKEAARLVGRTDLVSPATGHPECVRVEGQVKSVPGFVN